MSWQGANLKRPSKKARRTPASETVEAALNRLQKAYGTAMECVGAWHRADAALLNLRQQQQQQQQQSNSSSNNSNNSLDPLYKVGRAARQTLEHSIFRDGLVQRHAPAWSSLYYRGDGGEAKAVAAGGSNHHSSNTVELRSASHKSTVQQLAYLSLLNYGDLLLQGLPPPPRNLQKQQGQPPTILDRGVVQSLKSIQKEGATASCCWANEIKQDRAVAADAMEIDGESSTAAVDEPEEHTLRFALVAYLDASALDGSDPTLWLKLACVARRLGRVLAGTDGDQVATSSATAAAPFLKYRRLEKHALERAMSALPASQPQNRTALRALEEWYREEEAVSEYPPIVSPEPVAQSLVLELPRYSWSTFGRMLLRACKEGSSYTDRTPTTGATATKNHAAIFASPNVQVQLSPLLVLPTTVLANVCSFLEVSQIWKFETTCRAMSASIISARAVLDNDLDASRRTMRRQAAAREEESARSSENSNNNNNIASNASTARLPSPAPPQRSRSRGSSTEGDNTNKRVSKRVQSQIITSGKRTDRSNRRNSTEYCLLASTLGCSRHDENYQSVLRRAAEQEAEAKRDVLKQSSVERVSSAKEVALERLSDSSLHNFVERISARQSISPLTCLFDFVAHASMHVSEVFSSDPSGSIVMSSCLMDCFDLMARRSNLYSGDITSSWSASPQKVPASANLDRVNLFAVDLLHAELRLKQCDGEDLVDFGFESNGSFVTVLVPHLLAQSEEIDQELGLLNLGREFSGKDCVWQKLKVRCYWLAANFYLWRGRLSSNLGESREAEEEGLRFIEATRKCLHGGANGISKAIATPHLGSPTRRGQHWQELTVASLTAYADEIQASSIVLLAQEQFLEATAKFSGIDQDEPLEKADSDALFLIGESLLQRYDTAVDAADAKHSELIDDFLAVYGDNLRGSGSENLHDWFGGIITPRKVETVQAVLRVSNPCILTILTCCLKTKEGNSARIVTLLVRLVLGLLNLSEGISSRNVQQSERKKVSGGLSDSDSDDDSMSDDESLDEDGEKPRSADAVRLHQYASLIQLLLQKIREMCETELSGDERILVLSDELIYMFKSTLRLCSGWFQCMAPATYEDRSNGDDLGIMLQIRSFFRFLTSSIDGSHSLSLTRIYLLGLIQIITAQRQTLCLFSRSKPRAKGRAKRQEMTRRRADLVAAACCDAGMILSMHLVTVLPLGEMKRSTLFDDPEFKGAFVSPLVLFSEALSWLWKAASSASHSDVGAHLGSYLDSPGRARLRVPVAAAIVGLCGSASSTCYNTFGDRGNQMTNTAGYEELSLFEFYDSDASAIEWVSDEVDESDREGSENADGTDRRKKENLLRVIMQAVHCISCVFGHIDEKEAATFSLVLDYMTSNGPLLPLVVSRVLNHFSFYLLVGFAETESAEKAVWSDYSFGTRTIGQLLDTMLYKAYKSLHGFTLSNISSDSKDTTATGTSSTLSNNYAPESTYATVMLYRCVMRAYSNGRKSPPKGALDAISTALPAIEESGKTRAVRKFLFSANMEDAKLSKLVSLVLRPASWESTFESVDGFGWIQGNADKDDDFRDDVLVVRRGLVRLIAQGPLPTYQDTGEENDARSSSAHAEEELSRKFWAVIDDLCFGKTNDCEGWFKASQCLITKADLIADRLGLAKGFARCQNFTVSERQGIPDESLGMFELMAFQEREQRLKAEGWMQTVGEDISIFIHHSWSSFSSLKKCSDKIGEFYGASCHPSADGEEVKDNHFGDRVWYEIHGLFLKNDFVGWQQAWGGLFVSSLRKAAYRCLSIALYLSYKTKNDLVVSEIAESLGVSLYSELMGSQEYGYPIQEMTLARKRQIAEAALACFERAVRAEKPSNEAAGGFSEEDETHNVWDLYFMIGKCREKIAGTYRKERFPINTDSSEEQLVRGYERNMKLALQAYATSLSQAKQAEDAGDLSAEQNGGSSHGAVEVIYRLHASRLKCLIDAVDRKEAEREAAEKEALRLTECHWFADPEGINPDATVRERVWNVLVDVVTALARCRLDNAYFHRSVYRHAQALMWAPVLFDPIDGRAKGSLGTVSATWACKLRGLNYATHAASSAVTTMSVLFEKKRSQLVAVWVTADGTSSFQTINNSVRKFDSLRGKYIAAYIDSLRLCARRKELETLLRWTSTAVRDLPSYFAASAVAKGDKPQRSHIHDSLILKGRSLSPHFFLTTVKRQANSALANVIQQDLKAKPDADQKFLENQLKLSYACFLRLNCDPKVLSKSNAWKYHRRSGAKDVVEALTTAYLRVTKDQPLLGARSDWSGESQLTATLQMALQKCKEIFPSVSGKFFISKKTTTTKRAAAEQKGDKPMVEKSFVVAVPEGLAEGETFMASIKVGNTVKKVRLTVPSGNATSLRFNLQVPTTEDDDDDGADGSEDLVL